MLTLGIFYEYGWELWLKQVVLWEGTFPLGAGAGLCCALLAAALIYLAVVMFFTWIMGIVERRLRESDRR